jgi:hypothetical protein
VSPGFLLKPGQQPFILFEGAVFELDELRPKRLEVIALERILPLFEIAPGKILEDGFEGGIDLYPPPLYSQRGVGGIHILKFNAFSHALLIHKVLFHFVWVEKGNDPETAEATMEGLA